MPSEKWKQRNLNFPMNPFVLQRTCQVFNIQLKYLCAVLKKGGFLKGSSWVHWITKYSQHLVLLRTFKSSPRGTNQKTFHRSRFKLFYLKSISVHFGSSRYASCTCALKVQIQSSKVSQEPSKGLFFFFLTIPQPIKVSNLILVEPKQNAVTF